MSHAYLAVVNPAAGGGRGIRRAAGSLHQLRAAGIELQVVHTTHPGHATAIARVAYQNGQRHFIAVGGEGTTYELLNGLFPAAQGGPTPRIGLVPVGSGNSFIRDFSDGGSSYGVEGIIRGRRRRCDLLRLSHRGGELFFVNLLSMGFVADVASLRNRWLKAAGEVGYVLATVIEVARLRTRRFNISLEDGPRDREPLVFVSFNNSRFTGGQMMMAPAADPQDGKLDYVRVGSMRRLELLRTFPKIFSGSHIDHPVISTHQVERLDFDLQREVDIMVDGEVLRLLPRTLTVLPGVVEFMV